MLAPKASSPTPLLKFNEIEVPRRECAYMFDFRPDGASCGVWWLLPSRYSGKQARGAKTGTVMARSFNNKVIPVTPCSAPSPAIQFHRGWIANSHPQLIPILMDWKCPESTSADYWISEKIHWLWAEKNWIILGSIRASGQALLRMKRRGIY